MVDWFLAQHAILQALLAGLFTWAITAAGASLVFFGKRIDQRLLDAMLGFAAGVMLAASFWSLLAPAIEISAHLSALRWLPPAVGFALGGAMLWALDKCLPHLHVFFPLTEAEGPKSTWRRATLLVTAITLHNIPEGLAVGVAFGGVIGGIPATSVSAAVALSIGIGLQNFPEGLAVAMPLRGGGMGRWKSFWYGQLSAAVEPVAAVIGAAAVVYAVPVLPYALAFAAGAMVYVVAEELIPESQRAGNVDLATVSLMVGFLTMMILDVALA